MEKHLDTYRIRLIIAGIDPELDSDAPEALARELSMRGHIRKPNAAWLDDQKTDVEVTLEVEGIGTDRTAKGMAEELSEVTVAVLNRAVGTNVDIVSVETIGWQ